MRIINVRAMVTGSCWMLDSNSETWDREGWEERFRMEQRRYSQGVRSSWVGVGRSSVLYRGSDRFLLDVGFELGLGEMGRNFWGG